MSLSCLTPDRANRTSVSFFLVVSINFKANSKLWYLLMPPEKVATEEYWTTVSKWLTKVFPADLDEVVISGGASRFLEPDLEKHFNCEHKYEIKDGSYPRYTYRRIGGYQPYESKRHFTPMVWGAGFASEIKQILALSGKFEAENSLSYRLVDAYGLFDLLISKNHLLAKKASPKTVKQQGSVA